MGYQNRKAKAPYSQRSSFGNRRGEEKERQNSSRNNGRIEREDSTWIKVGSITGTRKGADNPEYQDIVDVLTSANPSFIFRVYLKPDEVLPLRNKDQLIIHFRQFDGDPEFVIGHVSMKVD